VRFGDLIQRQKFVNGRIVDQNIELAEFRNSGCDELLGLRRLAPARVYGLGFSTHGLDLCNYRFRRLRAGRVINDDGSSILCEFLRNRCSNSL
jgi:hypothetical protein